MKRTHAKEHLAHQPTNPHLQLLNKSKAGRKFEAPCVLSLAWPKSIKSSHRIVVLSDLRMCTHVVHLLPNRDAEKGMPACLPESCVEAISHRLLQFPIASGIENPFRLLKMAPA